MVYKELVELVEKEGKLIEIKQSLVGLKKIYKIGNYEIMIDSAPLKPEDMIVQISAKGGLIYVSPAMVRGLQVVCGQVPEPIKKLANPKILEKILQELK